MERMKRRVAVECRHDWELGSVAIGSHFNTAVSALSMVTAYDPT